MPWRLTEKVTTYHEPQPLAHLRQNVLEACQRALTTAWRRLVEPRTIHPQVVFSKGLAQGKLQQAHRHTTRKRVHFASTSRDWEPRRLRWHHQINRGSHRGLVGSPGTLNVYCAPRQRTPRRVCHHRQLGTRPRTWFRLSSFSVDVGSSRSSS